MFCPIFLALLLAAMGQQQKPPAPAAPTVDDLPPVVERGQKQFNFLPGGKLTVTLGVPGSCRIIGWQRSAILLETERVVYHLPENEARLLLDQFPLRTRWTQTTASIGTQNPPTAEPHLEVNLTIYVPKTRTDISINLTKGDLAIGSVGGWVEATLVEGSLEATAMSGYFSALTQRGDLRIEMAGDRWLGHSFTASTKWGSVDLRLPVRFSAALQLETQDGNLTVDFPAQVVDGEESPLAVVTHKKGKSVSATVGDGGAAIRLRTNAGDVSLVQLPAP
jgi:DUF4097 and DUF4098 domain-containing protein YvlB